MRSAKDYMKRIYSMPLGAILSWFLFSTFAVSAFADHRAEFLDRIEADATTRATLERALEDFDRIVAFEKPVHAVQSRPDVVLFDGGTTFWQGDGYKIVLRKTICRIGSTRGFFMYGPILVFDESVIAGDEEGRTISHIRLLSGAQLHKRLTAEESNQAPAIRP